MYILEPEAKSSAPSYLLLTVFLGQALVMPLGSIFLKLFETQFLQL